MMKSQVFILFFLSCVAHIDAVAKSGSAHIYYGKESFLEDVANPSVQAALPKTYRLLLSKLNVPIEFEYSPFKRSLRELNGEEPACNYYAVENAERKDHFLFSLPLTFLPSPRVYTHSPIDRYLLNEEGEIESLEQTLEAQPGKVILLTESISYGDELDKLISQLPERNIVWRASGDMHNKVSEMFFKHRTQMALTYPQEIKQFLSDHAVPDSAYYSYGVQGVPAIVAGKIMCNKHPANAAYLNDINKGILALYDDKEYLDTQLFHTPVELQTLLVEAIMRAQQSENEKM